jgi:signal peptidase I
LPDREGASRPGGWARFLRRLRSRRFRVADCSMAPTLLPGDRLYVDPAAFREYPPARGDLVVVRDPTLASRFLVKRVAFLAGESPTTEGPPVPARSVYVLGDDPAQSRDSRAFGAVPLEQVVGHAWFRYAPADRRKMLTATFK